MEKKQKKLVQINTVCNTSTGRIMEEIQREAIARGYETRSFVGRRKPFEDIPCEKIGNWISFWIHVGITTVFDRHGFSSVLMTRKLIKRLQEENPDVIHLHNLHGYYLNLPILFDYLKSEYKGKIFWTLHDCWAFTGHCAYFTMANCTKWKEKCHHCPNKKRYPISLALDSSEKNYEDKKKLFCGINNLKLIVPSFWMAQLTRQSFLNEYCVEVIPNGIDINTFSYIEDKHVFNKYNIPVNKKILLGAANVWDERKGLRDFLQLSKRISDEYRIVLVGLSKAQIRNMPSNIIGIRRTDNQRELAALYSLSRIFINPSVEESFSLVTVEAFACGTPVIVLNTSAVKELVTKKNGIVLKRHGTEEYIKAIAELERRNLSRDTVAGCARQYETKRMLSQIFRLYKS